LIGGGDAEGGELWLALRQQTGYIPQLQALPWEFSQDGTRKQQEESLKLHAEKKVLAVLIAYGEAKLNVAIEFNACMDCHSFFKESSMLLGRRIQLRQPKIAHAFTDGCCSCNDRWRWEVRLTPLDPSTPTPTASFSGVAKRAEKTSEFITHLED